MARLFFHSVRALAFSASRGCGRGLGPRSLSSSSKALLDRATGKEEDEGFVPTEVSWVLLWSNILAILVIRFGMCFNLFSHYCYAGSVESAQGRRSKGTRRHMAFLDAYSCCNEASANVVVRRSRYDCCRLSRSCVERLDACTCRARGLLLQAEVSVEKRSTEWTRVKHTWRV